MCISKDKLVLFNGAALSLSVYLISFNLLKDMMRADSRKFYEQILIWNISLEWWNYCKILTVFKRKTLKKSVEKV